MKRPPVPGSAGAGVTAPAATGTRRVLLQFRMIANSLYANRRRQAEPPAPGQRHLHALATIACAPGLRVSGLAQALGVRQPTASQMVKALRDAGLVWVDTGAQDHRVREIRLSDQGWALLRGMPQGYASDDPLPQALGRIDEQRLRSLEGGLSELMGALMERRAAVGGPRR